MILAGCPDSPKLPFDELVEVLHPGQPLRDRSHPLRDHEHRTLLRFESAKGARAAVIQSRATLPINLSVNERKALAGTGQPATGLGRGTNPVDRFDGHADFDQIAWLDPNTKSLIKSAPTEQLVLVVGISGLPLADQPPGGRATLAGTVTLDLQAF